MRMSAQKVGRNDPCPCGSGRKYKHCCIAKDRELAAAARAGQAAVGEILQRALQLHGQDLLEESADAYERAIAISPDIAGAHYNLGNVRLAQGKRDEAAASYRRALELQPDWSEACCNLGSVLKDLGRQDESAALYRRVLARRADDVLVNFNLGNLLKDEGKLEEAAACYRKVLSLDPKFDDAHWNLGTVLAEQGKADEALVSYLKARPQASKFDDAYCNLLFMNSYKATSDPREYLALARGWEQVMIPAHERMQARARRFDVVPLAGRRLKVGYVSGDFWQHAVSHFLERLLASHDRARVEVFAYYTGDRFDAVTARFQAIAEHWAPVEKLTEAALLERIRADGIDVLVDVSGRTGRNRLGVFARRAAPVQAHYLGYFASTGLTEMDYWIGDEVLTPAALDHAMSEQVWRLPRTWVSYGGNPQLPRPGGSPAGDGVLRIGTFTDLKKVKEASLELWSRLLLALPGSRLLLKHMELARGRSRQRVTDFMAARGISADRLELVSAEVTPQWFDHMAFHDRLDVGLDPIDVVSGGTTTCDALWMGVPVVTLQGERMGSRMTASILHGLGRTEWIANSPDDYIAKVVALARDPARRAALRSTLREEMAGSQLCDSRDLARKLEAAYAEMFERCQGSA
jgi:predicted O-linked N-acetylglucosamine transferase (SPINDLY family)